MNRPELWAPSVGEMVGTCADAAGALAVIADGAQLIRPLVLVVAPLGV